MVTLLDELAERILVGHVASMRQDDRQRLSERTLGMVRRPSQDPAARLDHQGCRIALREHVEMAGDIGFEGKLMEEAFAERVDRLDLEAAGSLEGPCKQAPRRGEAIAGRARLAEVGKFLAQGGIGQLRPLTKRRKHALGHLSGCRLGEGQAEDTAWIGAGEQEAHDPPRQHEGLAGAGIGRHPGGGARVRCIGDGFPGRLVDRQGRFAGHEPFPASTSHSRTRARWS